MQVLLGSECKGQRGYRLKSSRCCTGASVLPLRFSGVDGSFLPAPRRNQRAGGSPDSGQKTEVFPRENLAVHEMCSPVEAVRKEGGPFCGCSTLLECLPSRNGDSLPPQIEPQSRAVSYVPISQMAKVLLVQPAGEMSESSLDATRLQKRATQAASGRTGPSRATWDGETHQGCGELRNAILWTTTFSKVAFGIGPFADVKLGEAFGQVRCDRC